MPTPSDKTLDKELRVEAQALLDSGEEITVNKIRTRVEEKLDLPEQFFKESAKWKNRSKDIIHKTIVRCVQLPPRILMGIMVVGPRVLTLSIERR